MTQYGGLIDMRLADEEEDFGFRAVIRPCGQKSIERGRSCTPMHRRCEILELDRW